MSTARDEIRNTITERIHLLETCRHEHTFRANEGIIDDDTLLCLHADIDEKVAIQRCLLAALGTGVSPQGFDTVDKLSADHADNSLAEAAVAQSRQLEATRLRRSHENWAAETKLDQVDEADGRIAVVIQVDVLVFVDDEICGTDATNNEAAAVARNHIRLALDARKDDELSYIADYGVNDMQVVR